MAFDRGKKFERGPGTARLCGEKILPEGVEIFLFKPEAGEVLSIPIKDAIVEQIDKL